MAEHEESSGGVPPLDEEAAWAAIVAGYGQEPPDPPGARPFKPIKNLMLPEEDVQPEPDAAKPPEKDTPPEPALGSSVIFAPGVGVTGPGAGSGPRDHSLAEPKDDDATPADEGHFIPPEPDLPPADTTSKFAWLAVVGGPVLLLLAVLLQWEMTWWLTTLGIGGFLGGFATLVARMSQGDDDDDDDPGRGAVV
ncbi:MULTISPECIES: hypothetical protein [unclassified Streptomyces]|uniref:hypothetical protein n=1 Tax=unclassified Streptomyces TaxID=2593676 RepID=UPI001BE8A4DA|nr:MULTISPECIES: hypothetical protein [unclassified Streptomyces]MBT2405908.1 hypothetical protein [Streptomyces sp. ISL-21]MBT2453974.1 hypothetical protein [Streptomyces sp. ISL-86]MBT2612274.1 hypothetical protein [Streptomyces sp. ISL-87]